jgi:hypothetical protein
MPGAPTTYPSESGFRWSHDHVVLILASFIASISALVFYYHRGTILLYGDAVAHINIARRVFDSRTPGLFQLGTVWLPLPHLLDIPFVANDWLWRIGLGGSIPSMLGYVVGTAGVFRLVRGLASRQAAWVGALIYALNPNLLYMQATAMTESLYLAVFIWTAVFFSEFARQIGPEPEAAARSLRRCALALSAALLVRYDGWFLAAAVGVVIVSIAGQHRPVVEPIRRSVINFFLLVALTAGLWLAYNHAHWGNILEFANGPYSARAIQQQSRTPTMPTYPGENSPRTAALYFLKLVRLNLGAGFAEHMLFTPAIVALLSATYFSHKFLPWTLLWTPAVFYIVSIAWGSVPIYVAAWWPYSYYNVRYGLELLPAIAVFVALAYEFLSRFVPARIAATAIGLVVATSYLSLWRETPICLREAQVNGHARLQFDQQLGAEIQRLPAESTLMMNCGAHSGAVQAAGIHFRRILRESNPPYWEVGLSEPARSADYIIAIEGDDVARAVRFFPQDLQPITTVGTPTGPKAVIYQSMHH